MSEPKAKPEPKIKPKTKTITHVRFRDPVQLSVFGADWTADKSGYQVKRVDDALIFTKADIEIEVPIGNVGSIRWKCGDD